MNQKSHFKKDTQIKRLLTECLILVATALIAGFTYNYFSQAGIAMVGEWDSEKGVVTARAKNDIVDHELEIDSVQKALYFYENTDALFVDARSADSYKEGHIKGAISFPAGEFDDRIEWFLETYGPDTFVITYCSGRDCQDSHYLAQQLLEAGYFDISVFIDGYPAWKSEGHPVETNTE